MFECVAWYECHWTQGWYLALAAHSLIAIAYIAIAQHIFRGLWKSGQIRKNPLARATSAIFFTCSVGHGIIAAHLFLPSVGIEVASGTALRTAAAEWHMWLWPPVTAAAAVTYWMLRGRFPALVRGTAMFEDIRERQRRAIEINDNVVQRLTTAKHAMEMGDHQKAREAIDSTLDSSKDIMADLLVGIGNDAEIAAGDLQRERPADTPPAGEP